MGPPGGAQFASRSPMPIARNHIALDVNFPSSPRLEHPLTAGAQRPYRKSTSNGGSGGSLLPLPAQLQRGSSSSSNGSSNLHVFDFNSLPADKGPRTPRHPAVTPLNVRRQAKARTPLQQPAMHLPGGEGGPSYPNIPSASSSPSPPPSFPLGGGNLVSLSQLGDAPLGSPKAEGLLSSPRGLRPATRRLIRSRAMRSPRWQSDAAQARSPMQSDLNTDSMRVVGQVAA